jgi:hypothetical protein
MATTASVFSKANPTPFVMAFLASHVVTAIVLPSLNFTLWTGFDISVLSCPCIEFIITDIRTSHPSMVNATTFHTDFLSALTSCFCAKSTSFSDVLQTAISGTPTKIGI